jgi:hypothetical protein
VFLIAVVESDDRLVEEGRDPLYGSAVGSVHHLRRRHLGFEERNLHLGVPPVSLGLRDAPQAVAVHPQPALDDVGTKALCDLRLDQWDDQELALADAIFWPGLGEPCCLADDEQQLDGSVRLVRELLEGDVGERRPARRPLQPEIGRPAARAPLRRLPPRAAPPTR